MAAFRRLPYFHQLSPRFFTRGPNLYDHYPQELEDFYQAVCSLDISDIWERLANDDPNIGNLIFERLRNESGHSGFTWTFILRHHQQLARTGVPERFLVKNEKFWVLGYYMPDYLPPILFAAGAATIVAALKIN
jgi:hypothetical protein